MIVPPEVLGHIGAYLDNLALFSCALVNRYWNEVFEPCLWSSVDSNHTPWFWTSAKSTISMAEHQQRVSTSLQRHRQHIRDLKVRDEMLLLAALEANITGLVSLYLDPTYFKSTMYFHSARKAELLLVSEDWDELIPQAAFDGTYYADRSIDYTRALWRLVYMNPGLRRLVFQRVERMSITFFLMAHPSVAPNGAVTSSVLTPTSQSFLLNMLARLRSIRHLQVGQRADEYLFCNLNTLFPSLDSFVHSDMVDFNPRTVRLDPHRNLRSLKFLCTISPGQLRAVVVAFPELEELSVRRLLDNHHLVHYVDSPSSNSETVLTGPQWADDLVHSSLMRLAIDDMSFVSLKLSSSCGLLRSRTIYPYVTKSGTYIRVRCAMDLGRVLYVFPSALSLQIWGINNSSQIGHLQDDVDWKCPPPFFETWGRDHAMVKDLAFVYVDLSPSAEMNAVYAQMPLLTRMKLKHCSLDGTTLTTFSRYFKNLEYIEFNLNEPYSKELLDLLVGCPKLKCCVGKGHVVMADDIVDSPEWTCRELERLDIVVVGVPRLTEQQEELLDRMQDQGRLELVQATTTEEQEALDRRRESYAIQRKVYQRLGRHKKLHGCYLGAWRSHGSGYERVEDCLELTLASGLDELSVLENMKFMSFTELNHRIGEAEDLWVKERWNLARSPGGGIWHRRASP
ncbi:hypothetical protein BG015_005083 [Linnemannia schmuckeri]|uniref:F-box domain-containing protein n=1 Tax=Linnemannia schmuckeri TaxID=64567 RepID=A0A9P5VCM1_9FUNG|nr:hypothetical protein BG015_005083 [Linnemannia schmuckeri]